MNHIQSLNGSWNLFRLDHAGNREPLGAISIPGSVLAALLEKKKISDPFWRCEEYTAREIMGFDYLVERRFIVHEPEGFFINLVAYGLDTLAQIRLNGAVIARADDMHRTWRFPVKEYLQPGENVISIIFFSALNAARKEDAENDIFYASTGSIHGNGAIRKAHYMFGWDWGPQLPDAGIFRDIVLEYQDCPKLLDCRIRQEHREGRVTLCLETLPGFAGESLSAFAKNSMMAFMGEVKTNEQTEDNLFLTLTIEDPSGKSQQVRTPWKKEISYSIEKPALWWPNGVGEHPLYQIRLDLTAPSGEVYDTRSFRIGLRTITVCTDAHEYGNEFAFVVNGIKLFAMGANYIPEDNLLSRVTKERTKKLIKDCEKANFNCIRVWGGGYYPDDFFYDACDEAGILVWQDLMFACNVYRLEDHFEENIVEETKDNVRRIRHHACLALWCGNNEMEWGWGDEWARIKGHHPRYKADYLKIFEYILPKALKSCDDTTCYWPSSPSSGGSYDEPNALNRGDQHYWEVWHSGKPFTEYRKNYFSFCSEYGFQSFPGRKTIESFTLPQDRNIFSRVMESHQKNGTANGKILGYIADYFLYPKSMDALAYISQILQLKAIQYGVEHWRRNRGRCMGSLYWQLNDCWPVASWASIDYYGRWKALHYGARRFYAPIMVSACEKEELSAEITYFVHNDTLQPFAGEIEVTLMDTDFHVLWQKREKAEAAPMQVTQSIAADFKNQVSTEKERSSRFARVRLFDGEKQISQQVTLFVKPKHFSYPQPKYRIQVKEEEDSFSFLIQSTAFAQYVELDFSEWDAVFSDNYFDLTDEGGRRVWVEKNMLPSNAGVQEVQRQLRIQSVADSYRFSDEVWSGSEGTD